jgi:hypothetical protein
MPNIFSKKNPKNKEMKSFLGQVRKSAFSRDEEEETARPEPKVPKKEEPGVFSRLRKMIRPSSNVQRERDKIERQEKEAEIRRARQPMKTAGEEAEDFIKRLRRRR